MNAEEAKPKVRHQRNSSPVAPGLGREAKRVAAVILEVLAGTRTPPQAAAALNVSLPRYYQLESRGLRGLLEACEPRPRGRQRTSEGEMASLRKQNEQLQRDLTRQQSLARATQRGIGLSPAAAAPKTPGKRRRKPVVRALSMAARLQKEAAKPEVVSEEAPPSSSP